MLTLQDCIGSAIDRLAEGRDRVPTLSDQARALDDVIKTLEAMDCSDTQ